MSGDSQNYEADKKRGQQDDVELDDKQKPERKEPEQKPMPPVVTKQKYVAP